MKHTHSDKIFPLKNYYLIYAGIGAVVFYAILFAFFIHAERQAMYGQYVQNLVEKTRMLYQGVNREIVKSHKVTLEDVCAGNSPCGGKLRELIESIINSDSTFAKVKILNKAGLVIYDHGDRANEGKPYPFRHEKGFKNALRGDVSSKIEREGDGKKRFMEVYLPIYAVDGNSVVGILELYDDVSHFEKRVYIALKQALIVPTIIYVVFNLVLFLVVVKADHIIASNNDVMLSIRHNMEKYLSPPAMEAIYNAVTLNKELSQGVKQNVVIFFSDIRGFTNYSENNEPEEVVSVLNDIFELQARFIYEHGGIIDKFVGDEIMAMFSPKNAIDATLASLGIIKEIRDNPDIFFEVGISIHYGEAVVGSIGTKYRRDYTAIGNTVNTGARLCSACDAGEIIISSSVYELLTDDIKEFFVPKAALQLKGKNEEVKAYSFLGSRPLIKVDESVAV